MTERRTDHEDRVQGPTRTTPTEVAEALEHASALYDRYVEVAQIAHSVQVTESSDPATNIPLGLVVWE